jgi:hypothetical protein
LFPNVELTSRIDDMNVGGGTGASNAARVALNVKSALREKTQGATPGERAQNVVLRDH